ncbi:unnamed protein product [Darwinula stevensoni]|uniref:Uncharacterized protein n=1 Tax=Darwinula stevensoni TaxID=69355 RepID=A0A7R9AGG3_9CRUS|nr:unnamed protein product [Darwinula stevensoni]CAG0904300.1 unnamed protein product [Darwinula stevensoni]
MLSWHRDVCKDKKDQVARPNRSAPLTPALPAPPDGIPPDAPPPTLRRTRRPPRPSQEPQLRPRPREGLLPLSVSSRTRDRPSSSTSISSPSQTLRVRAIAGRFRGQLPEAVLRIDAQPVVFLPAEASLTLGLSSQRPLAAASTPGRTSRRRLPRSTPDPTGGPPQSRKTKPPLEFLSETSEGAGKGEQMGTSSLTENADFA